MRTRAERRHNNVKKAIRKRNLSLQLYWTDNYGNKKPIGAWYNNLHQYSKNKIHCSCPLCSSKTKNKGSHKNYSPSFNPTISMQRKLDSMNSQLQEVYYE